MSLIINAVKFKSKSSQGTIEYPNDTVAELSKYCNYANLNKLALAEQRPINMIQ
jgi:hypothetical protein